MKDESRHDCFAATHASSLMPGAFRGHCIRWPFVSGRLRRGRDGPIDVAHLLDLHPELDDLELVEAGYLFGSMTLLPFAEREQGGQTDEGAMGEGVGPAAPAQAYERVGGGSDVRGVEESERGRVAQLSLHVSPLLEGGGDDEQGDGCGGDDRSLAIANGRKRAVRERRQRRGGDGDGGGDEIEHELTHLVANVERGQGHAETGNGTGENALRELVARGAAEGDQGQRCRGTGRGAKDGAV